jgi:MoaA/NifB/PqqE/SkfB family radical SAM enzyme
VTTVAATSNADLSPPLVSAVDRHLLRSRIWTDVLRIARDAYVDEATTTNVMSELANRMGDVSAAPHEKCVKVAGRYFFDLNCPGWPSPAFDAFIRAELARIQVFSSAPASLQAILFAITKKCSLRCEHCSEWDSLNLRETLTRDDLLSILRRFQDRGVAQVQLSGGEPLRRFDDLVDLVRSGSPRSDLWLLTSGHGLTDNRARGLREAGLTGVQVSIDHWNDQAHDAFRGLDGAFSWALRAATAAARADLIVCLNLCATKAFVTHDNLQRYARLAAGLGASFIQILEPRGVGRYRDRDVDLEPQHQTELEAFFTSTNRADSQEPLPIVTYHGYGQRRVGCPSSGDRFLFVDTNGRAHSCPFCPSGDGADCRTTSNIDGAVATVRARGCGRYPSAHPCTKVLPEGSHDGSP